MPRIPFTAANARAMALLSHASTSARHIPKAARDDLRTPPSTCDNFTRRQLARVRKQIVILNHVLDQELRKPDPDPLKVERLTRSLTALSERERKLAGRPDPGHLRPGPPKRSHDPAAGSTCLDGPA